MNHTAKGWLPSGCTVTQRHSYVLYRSCHFELYQTQLLVHASKNSTYCHLLGLFEGLTLAFRVDSSLKLGIGSIGIIQETTGYISSLSTSESNCNSAVS